jgi:hypothetical protein
LVDVGVNLEQWEGWMLQGDGTEAVAAKTPTRKLVAEWIICSFKNMSEEMSHNSWRKKGFEWLEFT